MGKILLFVLKASLIWNLIEYFIFFCEIVVFAEEKYDDHCKHLHIAVVLTFINIALAIMSHFVS